jgi:hypothetical protein
MALQHHPREIPPEEMVDLGAAVVRVEAALEP